MKTFFKHTIMKTKILSLVFLLVNAGITLAQLPSTLYMVGNAVPIGWHIDKAIAMETVSNGEASPSFTRSRQFNFPFRQRDTVCVHRIYVNSREKHYPKYEWKRKLL